MKFWAVFFLGLFCFTSSVDAHEFKKIDKLFSMLQDYYSGQIDYKKLSFTSSAVLSHYDKNVRLYNSDTKAFLYGDNQLIKTFTLPQSDESALWRDFLTNILGVVSQYSPQISEHTEELENDILAAATHSLDIYSRMEKTHQETQNFESRIIQNILYLKPGAFYTGVADKISKIITKTPQAEGIILDLRGNRGGKLNEAIQTSNLFLDNGLIVSSREKNQPLRYYTATEGDIFNGKQIIILTDEYTASASEIVAAALSEQNRALIIGTKTYGKGSLQRVSTDENNTFFITNGYFYSPSGSEINKLGVTPAICTGIGETCNISNKNNMSADILLAVDLIKKNLG